MNNLAAKCRELNPLTHLSLLSIGLVVAFIMPYPIVFLEIVSILFLSIWTSFFKKFSRQFIQTVCLVGGIIFFFQLFFLPSGQNLYQVGIFRITQGGLNRALTYSTRLMAFITTILFLTHLIPVRDLALAIEQKGVSPLLSYILLASIDWIPEMKRRLRKITEAQKSRGIETEGSLLTRAKAFFPILAPVILSAIVGVEEKAITLEVRGFFSQSPKTYLREIKDQKIDHLLRKFAYFTIISLIIGRILYGFYHA
ncbi:energy-coupling factor transporter transmembrane protein EcfT [Atopobacter sp. AH10]|uniref:energy-coupling factor transporter transmembrane component T family protein n=1 Tax=Atopobacter sp. AH10 TaxID=2315861 RepID=UPI0013148E5B|nr:energy-coupling factor transporter transmembrane component T [Atopobacter sp. AH10]